MIRLARTSDGPRLRQIEEAAGEPFRELDMARIADDTPPTLETLAVYIDDGRCWVHTEDEVVSSYLIADVVDGYAHVEQVSVHPDYSGRRIGAALITQLDGWARDRGLAGLTLTTYRDVPWNAPYYNRLGFETVDEPTAGLGAIRRHEALNGLDEWPRVAMRRAFT
ncbi:GNAT family N-acetyltransferase [Antrihabitans sp. NCIMB 15449]|jgi:GNAT superfamily N-acetyltransferase|uniref:GNAT family N-acetyltransferase n=1 Tax=Antrihabitans spumae TaxID=3373370 RepID=A0ABW7JTR5_9NOCA